MRRAAGVRDAERKPALPRRHRGGGHRPLVAAERQSREALGRIEVLHQPGGLLDDEFGMRYVERRWRPHYYAVIRIAACVGEGLDLRKRNAAGSLGINAEAAQPRSERTQHLADFLDRASERDYLAHLRAGDDLALRHLADEHDSALRRGDVEHGVGRRDDAFEEPRMQLADVATDDDQ